MEPTSSLAAPSAGPHVERRAVVVMGMHRSGTSALAGALVHMGCDGPATPMASERGNERGHFESRRVYELHAAVLASAGSDWMDWAPVRPDWFASPEGRGFRDRAAEVIGAEFGASPLFVLKDPRICRLAPLWLGALRDRGVTPLTLHTHRHPLEVAASLGRRNRMDRDAALLLWLRHVLDAEAGTRGEVRAHTSYARLLGDWARVLRGVEGALGLALPGRTEGEEGARVGAFLSGALRHHEAGAPDPTVPGWVVEAHGVLERWAEHGEDARGRDALDRIRAALDAAMPAFAPMAKRWRLRERELSRALEGARGRAADRDALARELSEVRAEAGAERSRADEVAAGLEGRLRELAEAAKLVVATRRRTRAKRRELEEALAHERRLRADAEVRAAAERTAREAAEAEREAVLDSTSWRLTGPLRAVAARRRR